MERLNLSLDKGLLSEIEGVAKDEKCGVATAARQLLSEALLHRRRRELQRRMAAAYAAGARDPEDLAALSDLQGGQDDVLRREGK